MSDTKNCPLCGEQILSVAVKCKHCGSNISENLPEQSFQPTAQTDYSVMLLGIPAVGIVLTLFWIGSMNLFQGPGEKLMLVMIAVILGTATIAALEASKVGMTSDKKGSYSPTAWFFIISFIWIIGYPAYLFKRRKFGLKNRLVPAMVVATVFMISSFGMNSMIEGQKSEVRANLEQLGNTFSSYGD